MIAIHINLLLKNPNGLIYVLAPHFKNKLLWNHSTDTVGILVGIFVAIFYVLAFLIGLLLNKTSTYLTRYTYNDN